jgi:hypothetical protein
LIALNSVAIAKPCPKACGSCVIEPGKTPFCLRVAPEERISAKELHLYNLSPSLHQKIKDVLEQNK